MSGFMDTSKYENKSSDKKPSFMDVSKYKFMDTSKYTKKEEQPKEKSFINKVGDFLLGTPKPLQAAINADNKGASLVKGFTDSTTLGLTEDETSRKLAQKHPLNYNAGKMIGYISPGSLITKGVEKVAQKTIGTAAKEVGKRVAVSSLTGGALTGAENAVAQTKRAVKGEPLKPTGDILKEVGINTAAGGLLDLGLMGLGKVGSKLGESAFKNTVEESKLGLKSPNIKLLTPKGKKTRELNVLNKYYDDIAKSENNLLSNPDYVRAENAARAKQGLKPLAEVKTSIVTRKSRLPYTSVETQPVDNLKTYDIYRRDVPNAELNPQNKPQGVYYNIVQNKDTFQSPFMDVGNTDYHNVAKPKNPLIVEPIKLEHSRFNGIGGSGEGSSGVSALKAMVGYKEFNNLIKMDKPQLVKKLNNDFPGHDYNRYYDSYELLEAYSSQLAKSKGYDAIIMHDKTMPNFSEYIALDNKPLNARKSVIVKKTPTQKSIFFNELVSKTDHVVNPIKNEPINETITPPIKNTTLQPIKDVVKNNSNISTTTAENADSFMNKINVNPKKKTTNLGLKLRTDLVDRLAPLENIEKAIKGKIDSAEKSLYKTARNYFGTPEKAHEIIRTQLQPTLKEVKKQGYDIKELAAYAEAVHAKDVNASGIKSGFTDAEINDVINKYQALEPQRQQLMKLNNYVLDELVNGQVISQESANAMKTKWKNYMPLFRAMEDDKVEFGKGVSQTFANVASPIKTLKGSDKDVIDPIESMIKNVFQGINAAERNKVGLQLSDLAKEDLNNAFIRKLGANEEVGRKNVLNIKELGNNVKYEVHPELYKAMLNLDKESSTMLIRILSKPAGLLRAGATLTPEFAMRNPMRDVLNAYITSKSGFNPFTDFARGLASAIKKDDLYSKFIKANGAYGESISMDRNLHREIMEKALKNPGKQFVDIVTGKSLIKVLRAISDTTEKATKIGEFNKALKQGQTVEEAAYRARDLMDFARAGNSIKEANKVVAFLNANIQGKSKFISAIKEDPVGVSARIGKAIALPSIAAFAAQQTLANDEQKAIIKDAPDWLRDTFWLIPIPKTNQVARIPKPFDFAVFGNTLERFLAYTIDNDKEAFDNFARSTLKQQSLPTMLTGLVPIIEGMTNHSFFRDAPIIPQREENLQRKDQFDTYTSELSKVVAKGLTPILGEESNFTSPRIVDNTIRGVTAGMGGYALDIFDIILGKETEKPAKNISQLPVLKGFLTNENASGKSMEQLYNDRDRLTKEKNSAKLNKLPFAQNKELKQATLTADKVSAITKQIREITSSKILTPEQKRIKINELSDFRNKLTRNYKQGK